MGRFSDPHCHVIHEEYFKAKYLFSFTLTGNIIQKVNA